MQIHYTQGFVLYACGYFGHLWHRRAGEWRRVEAPTSEAKLNAVAYVSPERVYVGGNGVFLRGAADRWEALRPKGLTSIVDLAVLGERLFVVTRGGALCELVGDELTRVELPEPFACGALHSNAGLLLALGPRQAYLFDGEAWSPVALPG